MMSAAVTLFIIGLVTPLTKQINISCGSISQQSEVLCTCYNSGGQGVDWLLNGNDFTQCQKNFKCIPDRTGYTFTINSSAETYLLTINSHSYSNCGVYECRDFITHSNKDTVELSISDTYPDMSWEPEAKSEPDNHTDGTFNVTTPCLFDVDNVQIQWFTISNGSQTVYVPENNLTTFLTTSCQACRGVKAAKIQTSFLHKESVSGINCLNEVSFLLEMYYSQNQSSNKSIPFTGVYTICVTDTSETPNETNPDTSPGITATASYQIRQQPTSKSTINQDTCHRVPVPPIPDNDDNDDQCWIPIIIIIVITRLQYVQTWISGYSLYKGRHKIKDFSYEQSVEIIMILLTFLPCIGVISCIWAYFKRKQDHIYPKCLKSALAAGFIAGFAQPGLGLFITGAAYATSVQHACAFVFTSILFILLVGTEVALIFACTVIETECYYYILISLVYIVVWIIAVVIMIKRVQIIYSKKAVPPVPNGKRSTKESKKTTDESGYEYLNHGKTAVPPVTKGNFTTNESRLDHFKYDNLKYGDGICDSCETPVPHNLKGFCLEQKMLLCNSCFSKHKCKGKHLNHNQHDEGGRERHFLCEIKQRKGHRRNLPAHGYCLECRLYLCTECLIDHDKHELLWMPHHDAKTFDGICCFKTQTDRNSTIPLGFCITCKTYMCQECLSCHKDTHIERKHITIFHQHEGNKTEAQTMSEQCSECSKPMECYKLNVNKYLCADCYDSGSLWTKNPASDEGSKDILKESRPCELHNEVGERPAKYSPTDVFCIVCKLYLCKECFRVHRRFRERWIATHKENLFTCKGCQENNNVFPVECFSIKSKSFLCAACFEENKTTSKHATEKYLRPETITRLSTKFDCELHEVPFQFEERKKSSTVYCLLCKTYMCSDCFKKHLRLKQVWSKKELKSAHQTKSRNNEVFPMQTSM